MYINAIDSVLSAQVHGDDTALVHKERRMSRTTTLKNKYCLFSPFLYPHVDVTHAHCCPYFLQYRDEKGSLAVCIIVHYSDLIRCITGG